MKDGKFRPTEKKSKSGLTKEKLKAKSNNPIKEMKIAYKKHLSDKKKENNKKEKAKQRIEDNAEHTGLTVPTIELIQKLEGDDVFAKYTQDNQYNDAPEIVLTNRSVYKLYDDYDEMEAEAKDRIENDLEEEPYVFDPNWLGQFIVMDEYSKNDFAEGEDEYLDDVLNQEYEDDARENARERVEKELLKQGMKHEDITTDMLVEGEDSYYGEELDKLVLPEKERRKDEIIKELDNPVEYLINERGMFSDVKEMLKHAPVTIDFDRAVEDAIASDGVEHFISHWDGDSHKTSDGKYLVKDSEDEPIHDSEQENYNP